MFITHNDAQLYTVSFGSGLRTLLGLGGWAGSWELWTNPFADLSRSWRTVAYDHRGTGATVAPAESISLETMVSDVFAVMDALEIDRCVLAAESAGAAVALQAALRHPQRFSGLVLVDGMYFWPPLNENDPFLRGLISNYSATISQFVDNCLTESDGEAVHRWGRQILMRAPQESAIQLYKCMAGVDLRPHLHEIMHPTLILHGESDKIVPLVASEWLSTQLTDCHLHVVKGAGHVPTVTHPQEVAQQINRFFEQHLS
jgi:pimeloyl-ACP methyl ester carboxylesterase